MVSWGYENGGQGVGGLGPPLSSAGGGAVHGPINLSCMGVRAQHLGTNFPGNGIETPWVLGRQGQFQGAARGQEACPLTSSEGRYSSPNI